MSICDEITEQMEKVIKEKDAELAELRARLAATEKRVDNLERENKNLVRLVNQNNQRAKDAESELAAREYLDHEAQIGADLVNAELKDLREQVEVMRGAKDVIDERNAEIAQLRAVVDAARTWRSIYPKENYAVDFDSEEDLIQAVDALAAIDAAKK